MTGKAKYTDAEPIRCISEQNGINYGKAKAAELIEQNRVDVKSILTGIEDKNRALQGGS